MLNLYQLQIFQTVAHAGSFSRAAEQLYLSQPAVSQHIQALETDLGVRLFHRGRRGIRLTASGELLQDYARSLLLLAEKTRQIVAQPEDAAPSQPLQIGASPGVGVYLLPNWIQAFNSRFPELAVTVKTAPSPAIIRAITQGEIKLAVIEGELDDEPVNFLPLWDEEIVIVSPPENGRGGQRTISIADLARKNLIMREEGSLTRAWEMQLFSRHKLTPHIIAEFNSPAAIKQAVASGLGMALLPQFAVEAECNAGRLHALRLANASLTRTLKIIWGDNSLADFTVQAFISHLSHEFPHLLLQTLGIDNTRALPLEMKKLNSELYN
ncbi:MAG: selenium metabolism-associated LysR family transcriptional regulator [Anaerolineae bacterium]